MLTDYIVYTDPSIEQLQFSEFECSQRGAQNM